MTRGTVELISIKSVTLPEAVWLWCLLSINTANFPCANFLSHCLASVETDMRYARLTPGHGFKPANSFLYYLQRIIVSPPLRGLCVRMFRNWVRVRHGLSTRE